MAQRLIVDTFFLAGAGATLQGLAYPDPPALINVAGTDSVSAAVNETMPIIESPVIEGMPAARAALAKTASNVAAAAGMYADADHLLGRPLAQQEFAAAHNVAATRSVAVPADEQASTAFADLPDAGAPDPPVEGAAPGRPGELLEMPSSVAQMEPELNQIASTAGSLTQSIISGVQQAAQIQPRTDQVDTETNEQQAEHTEGVAPEVQEPDGVPTQVGVDATAEQPSASPPAAPVSPPTADRPLLTAKETDL